MTGVERQSGQWFVSEDRARVTDPDGNEFFLTKMGGVFLVGGPIRAQLDEDATVNGEAAEHVRSIVESARKV